MDLIEALVLVVELGLAFYLAKKIHPRFCGGTGKWVSRGCLVACVLAMYWVVNYVLGFVRGFLGGFESAFLKAIGK